MTGMFADALVQAWMPPAAMQAEVRHLAALCSVAVVHHKVDRLTPAYVAALRQDRCWVHASNCNSEADLDHALSLGVDQLSTDRLGMALRVRARRHTE